MRDWRRRIFTIDNLPLIVVIFAASIVFVLHVFRRTYFDLQAMIVLFLDILAFGLLVQRVVFLDRIERSVATIRAGWPLSDIEAFHSTRESLPGVPELLRRATQEVFVVGMSLGTLVGVHVGQVAAKAEKRCQVRLLMMSPVLEDGSPNPLVAALEEYSAFPGLDKSISANIEQIVARQNRLESQLREYLQLRVYFDLPTLTIFFMDAALSRGQAVIELLPYRFDPTDRPSFELSASRSEELLSRLYSRYEEMWHAARSWPPTELELIFLGKGRDEVGPEPSRLGPDGHEDAVFLLRVGPWTHARRIGQMDLFRTDERGTELPQHWTSSEHQSLWQLGVSQLREGRELAISRGPWVIRAQERLHFVLFASDTVPRGELFTEGEWYKVQVHHEAGDCTARTCLTGA